MLLREFFTYNQKTEETDEDRLYAPERDNSRLSNRDTRKTRLTLRQINNMRLIREIHEEELKKEKSFISRMYAAPSQE